MTNLSIETAAIRPKLLTVADLKRHVGDYLSQERLEVIERAYEFAVEAHQGQLRKSGEPYVQHPLQAACLVADLRMDASTIVATLLHDTVEDCGVSLEELQKRFGPEVAVLVDGVTKLSKIALSETALQDQHRPANAVSPEENLRKMLLAMAEDIRVVIIKLADRLHNMRTPPGPAGRPASRHRPGNPGDLRAPGHAPGHLAVQMGAGRPLVPLPGPDPAQRDQPDADHQPRHSGGLH